MRFAQKTKYTAVALGIMEEHNTLVICGMWILFCTLDLQQITY